jgi:hypothetical protein
MTIRTCAGLLAVLSICGCATPNGANTAGGPVQPSACLTSTGSRIPAGADTNCTAMGRSYSRRDIDMTGQTSAAGALRDLDPGLTINH